MSFIQLTIASIKMFFRDWRALFFSLFLPILFMTIFGLADFGKYANSKIGIVDLGQTDQSKELLKKMDEIDILDIKTDSEDILKDALKKGDLDLVLILPKDLVKMHLIDVSIPGEDQLPSYLQLPKIQKPQFDQVELDAYINNGRKQQAESALTILREVFTKLNFQVTQTPEIYSFKEISISDKAFTYLDFLVPGIVALSIMQMSLMSIIFTIVGYREKGILRRLQITPIKSHEFTLSQIITRLIISFLQVLILILIAINFFHLTLSGSYWLIMLLTIIGSIIFIAMGLSLSSVAKNQDTAAPLANILMLPMMFLGNVFFPVNTMPQWLQNIVQYLPLNFLSDALRKVMIDSATISVIKTDMTGLLIWLVAMVFIASITFRWKTAD